MRTILVSTLAATLFLAAGARGTDTDEFRWLEARVAELQPAAHEKRFDEIGWAADIREAKRMAKAHQRPVFLFTHDGRMNVGRC